ncbi:transposase DNA-binding-containing protein [Serratia fonticola]|uniref:transposase DNA-binding-containing protein n=1 Tax=Serratia fonticola TaxID=47917 RepID=UPI003BB606C6
MIKLIYLLLATADMPAALIPCYKKPGREWGKSLPFACQDHAVTKAAYRFLSSTTIVEQTLLQGPACPTICSTSYYSTPKTTSVNIRQLITLFLITQREFAVRLLCRRNWRNCIA